MGNIIAVMNILKTWLSAERGRAAKLAQHLKVPASFVTKMASGEKPIPFEHGAPIETFTEQEVTRQGLFPDDWRRVWPELVEPEVAGLVLHVDGGSTHAEAVEGSAHV